MLWMHQRKTVWCSQAVGVRGQCTNWFTALTLRVYHSHLWVVLEVFSETKHTTKEALIWRRWPPQQGYGIFGPDTSSFFIFQVVFVSPFEHHSNLLPWKEIGAEVSGTPSVGYSFQSCSHTWQCASLFSKTTFSPPTVLLTVAYGIVKHIASDQWKVGWEVWEWD